jgi:hypothetical protein
MSNFKELGIGEHIVFKKSTDDDDECAKIKSIDSEGYGVKQYFNGLVVSGFVSFTEIIRQPCKKELSEIRGSQAFDLTHRSRRSSSIVGFKSNIMKTRKVTNNDNKNDAIRETRKRLRGIL